MCWALGTQINDERLTSQVICREYLIYLDGFSSLLEMQGVSIMLTYQHTQQSADPELKTRALSAISAASSKEMFGPDFREGDDEHRVSWARSVGNGSISDDDADHARHGSSLSSHVSPTDVTSSSTEPFANAPRRALERPSSADHSDLEHLEPASVHLHALALSSAGAVSLFTEESGSPNDGCGEGSPRPSFASQIGIRLDDHLRVSYSVTCYHLHCDSSMVSPGQTEYKVQHSLFGRACSSRPFLTIVMDIVVVVVVGGGVVVGQVFPPLREPTDRRALHAAVSNTSNAIVCSGHTPVPHPLKVRLLLFATGTRSRRRNACVVIYTLVWRANSSKRKVTSSGRSLAPAQFSMCCRPAGTSRATTGTISRTCTGGCVGTQRS